MNAPLKPQVNPGATVSIGAPAPSIARPAAGQVDDDTLVITFRKPIMFGTAAYTSCTLSEPTGKQLEESFLTRRAGVGATLALIELNARPLLPRDVVDAMGARDIKLAADFFSRFLGVAEESTSAAPPPDSTS